MRFYILELLKIYIVEIDFVLIDKVNKMYAIKNKEKENSE